MSAERVLIACTFPMMAKVDFGKEADVGENKAISHAAIQRIFFIVRCTLMVLSFIDKYYTPHLKWKKLLNNSSWDFEHVLDTMNDYWVGPDEFFCPGSTPTRWRCNNFSKKWSKSKFHATLSIKKPFVTPKFCGWNFSQMHHFEDMNFLSPIEPLYSSSSL